MVEIQNFVNYWDFIYLATILFIHTGMMVGCSVMFAYACIIIKIEAYS